MIILEKDEIQQASYSRIIHLLKDNPPTCGESTYSRIIHLLKDNPPTQG